MTSRFTGSAETRIFERGPARQIGVSGDPYFQKATEWPYHQKLLHVASSAETASAAAFAYDRLLTYKQASAKQFERMWDAASAAAKFVVRQPPITAPQLDQVRFLAEYRDASAALVYETHFYFIAWFNCAEMLQTLTTDPAFLPARKEFNRHKRMFEHYVNARHSFEHFADRLPGGRESKKVVEVSQGAAASPSKTMFGINFTSGEYSHSNKTWDISQVGLLKLHAVIDDVLVVLHGTVDALIDKKFPAPMSQ
jgi:hypothetical protein